MNPQSRRILVYGGAAVVVLIVAGTGAVTYRSLKASAPHEISVPAELVNPPGKTPGNAGSKLATVSPSAPAAPSASTPGAKHHDDGTPSFDVVRVEPSGESVIAGRAEPNSKVELLTNGKVTATAQTDAAGEFVIVPGALKPGNHQLVLRATDPAGHAVTSRQAVLVSVPDKPGGQLLVVAQEPGAPARILNAGTKPGTAATGTLLAAAGASPATAPASTVAPATAVKPDAPVAAAQATEPHVDAVEAEAGHLFVQGRGAPGKQLNLYLNDAPVAGAVAGPDGRWSLTIRSGLTAGNYHVRVDQLGKDGKVEARAAAPFDYEPQTAEATAAPAQPSASAGGSEQAASDPAAAGGQHAAANAANPVIERVGTVSIVKGDNLWRISRQIYGHGIRYTVIYAANENQIRDPDLIYPGQVFVVPPPDPDARPAQRSARG